MSAQWRTQQKQNLIQGQQMMGQQQDVQFQTNQLDPWNMKANMANEQRQAGNQNLWNGLEGMSGNISQYAGTSAYLKALQAMNPNGVGGNGNGLGGGVSKPLQGYSPQDNLNNTLSNLTRQIKING